MHVTWVSLKIQIYIEQDEKKISNKWCPLNQVPCTAGSWSQPFPYSSCFWNLCSHHIPVVTVVFFYSSTEIAQAKVIKCVRIVCAWISWQFKVFFPTYCVARSFFFKQKMRQRRKVWGWQQISREQSNSKHLS